MERRTGSRTVVIATVWLYERKSPLKANLAVGNSIGHTTPACSSAQLRAESASSNNWLMIGLNGERTQASATEPKSSTTAAYPRGRPCMHWTPNSGLLQNRVMRHLHYLTNSSLLGPRSDRGRITTRGNGGDGLAPFPVPVVERTASSIWRRDVSSEVFEMLRTMGATTQRTATGMSRLSAIASSST